MGVNLQRAGSAELLGAASPGPSFPDCGMLAPRGHPVLDLTMSMLTSCLLDSEPLKSAGLPIFICKTHSSITALADVSKAKEDPRLAQKVEKEPLSRKICELKLLTPLNAKINLSTLQCQQFQPHKLETTMVNASDSI